MTDTLRRILLAATLLSAATAEGAGLRIDNAWVREAPPGAAMLAAYLTLHNDGDQERVLVAVDSPRFSHVMLHRSLVVDGIARMEHVDELKIPAGGSLSLAPGGYHLMLSAVDPAPRAGDKVEFVLHFRNGEAISVQLPVRRAGSGH